MTTQLDCSIGFKKESAYGTAVTVDRFLEFTNETLDKVEETYDSAGMRPGNRVIRASRTVTVKDGAGGDIELEIPSRGLGTLLEVLFGTATSTQVAGALYQQLFTLQNSHYLPSLTIQKGLPILGEETPSTLTFTGAENESFEISMANADVLKLKSTWRAREAVKGIEFAVPSYATSAELFSFIGGTIVVGGTITVPTTTALGSSTGTVAGNIRDFSVSVSQGLDGNGYNLDGTALRSRRSAVGRAPITGKITAEYDSTTLRDAVMDGTPLSLLATFQAPTDITTNNKPTFQIVIPHLDFGKELPKSNGGDVITQSLEFRGLNGEVAAHALYIATRTADTAL